MLVLTANAHFAERRCAKTPNSLSVFERACKEYHGLRTVDATETKNYLSTVGTSTWKPFGGETFNQKFLAKTPAWFFVLNKILYDTDYRGTQLNLRNLHRHSQYWNGAEQCSYRLKLCFYSRKQRDGKMT